MSNALWKALAIVLLSIFGVGAALALPVLLFPELIAPSMAAAISARNALDTTVTLVITDTTQGISFTSPELEPGASRRIVVYKGDGNDHLRTLSFSWVAFGSRGEVLASGVITGAEVDTHKFELIIAPPPSP